MTHRLRQRSRTILLSLALLLLPAVLHAQDTGWNIPSFDAQYTINPDRTIDVTERIVADFGGLQKHGLLRDIRVRYARVVKAGLPIRAGTVKVGLKVLGVTDGAGRSRKYSVSHGSMLEIKIGDPDRLVTGAQTYIIHYRLARGLGFFDDHDELYWQVTGTEWPVPILHAAATVTIAAPQSTRADTLGWSAWCYAGTAESSSNDRCTATVVDAGQYHFATDRLDPGEGLTLVAGFPKGVVAAPTRTDELLEDAAFWWPAVLPLFGFFFMFRRWQTHGRDPDPGSIVPVWNPPAGLPAGAAGTLIEQRAGMDHIVATLIDLAVRGYLKITEVPAHGLTEMLGEKSFAGKALHALGLSKTDWELKRTDKPDDDLLAYERLVLAGVFSGGSDTRRMSELHNEFYKYLPGIKKAISQYLVAERLFLKDPDSVRARYVGGGVLVMAAAVGAAVLTSNVVLGVGLGLVGIIVIAFSGIMPAKTEKGALRWREVKGLEEYIRRAEKLELEITQAPKRTTELFSVLLPYAIALDVSAIWLKQFAPILSSNPPTWYVGMGPSFSSSSFSSGLGGFQSAASQTMASAPGSSSGGGGGGSVGGGGGGGGGGSW